MHAAGAVPRARSCLTAIVAARKAQRTCAEPADWPGGDLEHEHARPAARSHGTPRESARGEGRARQPRCDDGIDDRLLLSPAARPLGSRRSSPRRMGRRADRACRKSPARCSAPWVITPSSANSRAGDESLDERHVGAVAALGADIGRLQQRPQPIERRHQFGLVESTRITPRLPDSSSGLTTHGNARPSAGGRGRSRCIGRQTTARADRHPAAARGCAACCAPSWPRPADGREGPSASSTRAAITVGRSPTAMTPSIGVVARASRIVAVDPSSS